MIRELDLIPTCTCIIKLSQDPVKGMSVKNVRRKNQYWRKNQESTGRKLLGSFGLRF
jgi:hypothetical protein